MIARKEGILRTGLFLIDELTQSEIENHDAHSLRSQIGIVIAPPMFEITRRKKAAIAREYYRNLTPLQREDRSMRSKKWRLENSELMAACKKKWRTKNPSLVSEASRLRREKMFSSMSKEEISAFHSAKYIRHRDKSIAEIGIDAYRANGRTRKAAYLKNNPSAVIKNREQAKLRARKYRALAKEKMLVAI